MDSNDLVFITRVGRCAKQRFILYQTNRSRTQKQTMPMESNGEQVQVNDILRQRQEIANEQERLRKMRDDLERATNNLHAQQQAVRLQHEENIRQQNLLNQPDRQRQVPSVAATDVGIIMNQFSYLQLDIKPPKFNNEFSNNPVEFLKDYDRFCQLKRIDDENKKLLILQCFEGKART